MPEGDAVWRTARRLHSALAGNQITDCDLRWPSLATTDLRGRTTLEVVPRGKHLLHRVEGGVTLHTHLRMEGAWRVHDPARLTLRRLRDPEVRAVVGCATATALGLRLGMMDVLPTREEHRLVGHLGPDLLGPDWDPGQAVTNLLRRPERALGAALLDQRNLAGVGTMWDAETLHQLRLWPWTPVGEVGPETLLEVVVTAQRLVAEARQSPPRSTRAHGRSGLPCHRCGQTIRISRIGEPPQDRAMFYCPTCQGGLGPDDDGRPQRPLAESAKRL